MSMTKTDYEMISKELRYADKQGWTDHIELMAESLADTFEASNPKFNRDKFLQACGVDG